MCIFIVQKLIIQKKASKQDFLSSKEKKFLSHFFMLKKTRRNWEAVLWENRAKLWIWYLALTEAAPPRIPVPIVRDPVPRTMRTILTLVVPVCKKMNPAWGILYGVCHHYIVCSNGCNPSHLVASNELKLKLYLRKCFIFGSFSDAL